MSSVMESTQSSTPRRPESQDDRDLLTYEGRLSRPMRQKVPEFLIGERLRHVIFSGQFSPPLLDDLADVADTIRQLSKHRAGTRLSH